MLRSLYEFLSRPFYLGDTPIGSSVSTLRQFQTKANETEATNQVSRQTSGTTELQAPPADAGVDQAQKQIKDYVTRETGDDPAGKKIRSKIETINTTIDWVQSRMKAGTADSKDIEMLANELNQLDTLLNKVKVNHQSPTEPAEKESQPPAKTAAPLSTVTTETNRQAAAVSLDPSNVSVSAVQTMIDSAADERGESVNLDIEAGVSVKVWKVLHIGKDIHAGMEIAKDNDGRVYVSMTMEEAVKAGVNVKLLEAYGKVGQDKKISFMFENSKDAAAFTVDMLKKNNPANLLKFSDEPVPHLSKEPTIILEGGGFLGGEVEIKTKKDWFNFKGDIKREDNQQFYLATDSSGKTGLVGTASISKMSGSADFSFKGKSGIELSVKFQAFEQETKADSGVSFIREKGGEEQGGTLEIKLSQLKKLPDDELRQALKEIARNMKLPEAQAMTFIDNMFNTVKGLNAEVGASVSIVIEFKQEKAKAGEALVESQSVGEEEWKTQYVRVSLKTEAQIGGEANLVIGGVKAQATVSKKEVVKELVYTETLTYIREIHSNPTEWAKFVKMNPELPVPVYDPKSQKVVTMTVSELDIAWKALKAG